MKLRPARGRLSVAEIMSATDGIAADGNGLYLKVAGTRASWVFRYTSSYEKTETGNPKRVELGLGSAERDDRGLCETAAFAARETALEFTGLLARGIDPKRHREGKRREEEEREQAQRQAVLRDRRTLGRVVRLFHDEQVEGAYDDKYRANWIGRFEKHARPWIDRETGEAVWDLPIDKVEARQLADLILHVQKQSPSVAKKLRQGFDQVFEYAALKTWVAKNIVTDIRRTTRLRSTRATRIQHSRGFIGLPYQEAPAFMKALRKLDTTAARCIEFTVLTATRPGEAREARWSEFDLDKELWVIPAERMKNGQEHRVYLSPAARAVLYLQQDIDPEFVFPSPVRGKKQPLSDMSAAKALDSLKMRGKIHVHGFRKSFSTWANEKDAARHDVIEAALAHRDLDVIRRTYNLAKHYDERRALMARWAQYLDGPIAAANEPESAS